MSAETVRFLGPEIILLAVAVGIYLAGAMVDARRAWSWIALGGLALAAAALAGWGGEPTGGTAVAWSPLAEYFRWLALGAGALLVVMTVRPASPPGTSEYLGSLLLTLAGVMLVSVAGNLVLLFVCLELVSIPTYILLYLGRHDAGGQEATAKYFFLSVLASAILLYGFALLYGSTGTMDLAAIRDALGPPGGAALPAVLGGPSATAAAFSPLGHLALILILTGLSFKITAVPFHFYAPDVYEGTSHANAALLSVIPKAAGLVVLVRLLLALSSGLFGPSWQLATVLAVLSMTLGNTMALWQGNLRRLLAYSSIAHAGYMLIALAAGMAMAGQPAPQTGIAALLPGGIGAMVFYLAVYGLATVGAFAVLAHLGRPGQQVDAVDELAGLGRTRPWPAAVMACFMFSLAGVPPLAGFWGKLMIFTSALSVDAGPAAPGGPALHAWFVTLAVVGVLNAAVAAAYYLRVVTVMYFRTPLAVPRAEGGGGPWAAAVLCGVLVLALGVYPGPLIGAADRAGSPPPAAQSSESVGPTAGLAQKPAGGDSSRRQSGGRPGLASGDTSHSSHGSASADASHNGGGLGGPGGRVIH